MRIFLDENLTSKRLKARLADSGHDVMDVLEAGLVGAEDRTILDHASATSRALLTADVHDRELIGVWDSQPAPRPLLILMYSDNRLMPEGIAEALTNLESSGTPLTDRIEVLVNWRRPPG